LAQRSRKRGKRNKRVGAAPSSPAATATTPPAATAITPPAATAPSSPAATATTPPATSGPSSPATPGPSRPVANRRTAEQRNAAVRAGLAPLAPGERPWSIRIAALIALMVGGGDLIDVIVGGRATFGGTHTGVAGVVLFSLLMIVCAGGMWQMRYWAVLGFQAVLAIVILIFALLLIRASNLLGFLIPIVIIVGGGTLFFKLVRVLSRLQMPTYPGR
jgi:hypothetical protein